MNTITTVAEMQSTRARMTASVALVPTMGALHEGHISLVRQALADNAHVIVSIFVNPTQFNESADFEHYPRYNDRDLKLLETEGVETVFIPPADEIYPPGFDDWVEVVGPLTERLEGAARPGHFRGVTTIVARLFRIIRPHRAYFGQKDAQQLRVIRRMVTDLNMDVEIVPMPIIRDPDDLALSSRNVHLSPDERRAALALPRALALARSMVMDKGVTNAATVREALRDSLQRSGVRLASSHPLRREMAPAPPESPEPPTAPPPDFEAPRPPGVRLSSGHPPEPDPALGSADPLEPPTAPQPDMQARSHVDLEYASVADEQTLEELDTIDRPALILLAARIGATRLIDNTIVVPRGISIPEHLAILL